MDTDIESEFADKVIKWFEDQKIPGDIACQELSRLLIAISVGYGYSEQEFDMAMNGLKKLFKSCKRKHGACNADQS